MKNSRTKYRVNEYVNIMVLEVQPDREAVIKAYKSVTGEKTLVIPCDDENTFRAFYREAK